jgi:hypothetical protein
MRSTAADWSGVHGGFTPNGYLQKVSSAVLPCLLSLNARIEEGSVSYKHVSEHLID